MNRYFLMAENTGLVRRLRVCCVGLVLLLAFAGTTRAQDGGDTVTPGVSPPIEASPVSDESSWLEKVAGSLDLRFTHRSGEHDSDSDIHAYLQLKYGNEYRDEISFVFFQRLFADLDGDQRNRGFYAFDSLTDTHDTTVDSDLLYAYVNYRPEGRLELIRVGRQNVFESPWTVYFDGARVDSKPIDDLGDLRVSVYGGVPVYFFEASRTDDRVIGANVNGSLTQSTWIRADYLSQEEDYREYGTVRSSRHAYSVRQWIGEWTSVYARAAFDGSSIEDLLIRGLHLHNTSGTTVEASVMRQYEDREKQALFTDPFTAVAGAYVSYYEFTGNVGQDVRENMTLSAGVVVRRLEKENEESAFNHEFEQYTVGLDIEEIVEDVDLSVTVDSWRGDDSLTALGADLHYKLNESWTIDLGTALSRYVYDYYEDDERTDVRSLYLRAEHELSEDTRLTLRFDLDQDEEEQYHRAQVGIRRTF